MRHCVWILILSIGISANGATDESASQSRTVRLPSDASLGRLKIRDRGSLRYEDWKDYGPARGQVTVPQGKELMLTVTEETFENLAKIASFGPNDISDLNLLSGNIKDSDLRHIERLEGLQYLLVKGHQRNPCPFIGDGLRYLKAMKSLREITLHYTRVRDEHFVHLKDHKCLENISLVGDRNFTGERFKYLKGLKSLRTLWIYDTPIEDDSLRHIKQMTSLEVLSLPETRVTDYGLEHLAELKGLKQLTAPDTISNEGLMKLKALSCLEILRIRSDAITDEGLVHLKDLRSLKSVRLRSSTLTGEGLVHLRDSPHLSELELWLNQMNDSTMRSLKNLPVTTLYLMHNNGVSDDGLRHIGDLTGMQNLFLDDTKITDSGLVHLRRLALLESLDLSGTNITDKGLAHLKNLTKLRYLTLSGTDIGDCGLAHLQNLKSIERLWLGETFVGDAGLKYLKGLCSLRDLVLMHTYVTGKGLGHLKQLKSLRYLYLSGTDIGEEGAGHLKDMTWLQQLQIDDRAASPEQIRSLRDALPDCRLVIEQAQVKRRQPRHKVNLPPSLMGKPLPDLNEAGIKLPPNQIENKRLLLCFFDMNQRPSRNCIIQLAKRAKELETQDIIAIAVQASKIDEKAIKEWIKKYNMPFYVATIQADIEKTRFTWGVRSLPWLILIDKEHIVRMEGFTLSELNDTIQ
jgi:Leucine-rich repeat (LRR) protein